MQRSDGAGEQPIEARDTQRITRRVFGIRAANLGALAATGSLLAACGGSDDSKPASTAAGARLTGELKIWDWHYGHDGWGDALKQIDQAFMGKHPGVTIKHVGQPAGADYANLIRTALLQPSAPDVLMMQAAGASPHAIVNFLPALHPIEDLVSDSLAAQYAAQDLDLAREGNDPSKPLYGIPASTQGIVIYFNKKLFRKAGLPTDAAPNTYEAFVEVCRQLKAAGIVPIGNGNKEGYSGDWAFESMLPTELTLEESIALARGDLPWTDAKVRASLQKYVDLVEAGYFRPGYNSTPLFTTAVEDYSAGKSAMFIGLASDAAAWQQFGPALGEDNLGVFFLGMDASGPAYAPLGAGAMWAISQRSSNKDAAWAWIQHVASPEMVALQLSRGGVLPANNTVPVSKPVQPAQLAEAGNKIPKFLPSNVWTTAPGEELVRQFQLVTTGNSSVDAALEAVEAAAQKQS